MIKSLGKTAVVWPPPYIHRGTAAVLPPALGSPITPTLQKYWRSLAVIGGLGGLAARTD